MHHSISLARHFYLDLIFTLLAVQCRQELGMLRCHCYNNILCSTDFNTCIAGALNMQSFRHHHRFCFFVFCLPRCVQTRGSGGGHAELLAMLQCRQWGCSRIDFFFCGSLLWISSLIILTASKSLSAWNILLMWTSKRRPPPPCLIAKTIFPNYKRSMKEGENEWLNT